MKALLEHTPTLGDNWLPALVDVATPALVLEASVVMRNLQRMANYCTEKGIQLRPHTKTHKSVRLAQMQVELGASGLTAAKAGEAEVMATVSKDILVAYPALDVFRTRRLANLSQTATVRVAVDSAMAIQALAEAANEVDGVLGILIDFNVGMNRTGLTTAAQTMELATLVEKTKGVRLDGLFCYPGHVWCKAEEQPKALGDIAEKLEEVLSLWKANGLGAEIVSGGSTPTAYQSHHVPAYTEIRPGTYVFNDMNTVRGGFCSLNDCAASILCTVISTSVAGQVVLDGGSKTFGMDRCIPALDSGHGLLVDYPGAKITALSEEHAQVDVTACERIPQLGDRVRVIPNHICPCVNLQDQVVWMEEQGHIEIVHIDARGMLS